MTAWHTGDTTPSSRSDETALRGGGGGAAVESRPTDQGSGAPGSSILLPMAVGVVFIVMLVLGAVVG